MPETAAVICEYNPFHNGHLIQLEKIRKIKGDDTRIVAIMSGSIVQRGTLAIYPKYARAAAAVKCGVDLVLELPCPFSCGSAEYFARAGVMLADLTGIADSLCFGSESGDITALEKAADRISSPEFLSALRNPDRTESHQRNTENLYLSMFGSACPTTPNDILAVSYLSAIKSLKSSLQPFTYKREPGFTASGTRKTILSGGDASAMLPPQARDSFSGIKPTADALCSAASLYVIRNTPAELLCTFYGMNGGVSGCLRNNADAAATIEELVSLCTGRKYSASRLRRAILSAVIGIKPDDMTAPPYYTTLLAANSRGREMLSAIKKTGFPVVTKPADGKLLPPHALPQYSLGRKADALFALSRKDPPSDMIKMMPTIV